MRSSDSASDSVSVSDAASGPARRRLGAVSLLPLLLAAPAPATAAPSTDASMLTLYRVAPDHADAFATGYAQHIRWHVDARDPWAWYVWQIRSGPDRGHFVGGTFDHAWDDLDHRPQPDADAADHRKRIDAHVSAMISRHLIHRRDLGGTLPVLETSPHLIAIELRPVPGHRAELEAAARRLAALAGPDARFGWFEVAVGGGPGYVLLAPLARTAELPATTLSTLWRAPAARAADVRAAVARLEATASIDSELLGFRPELSSCVRAETRCAGLVPSP